MTNSSITKTAFAAFAFVAITTTGVQASTPELAEATAPAPLVNIDILGNDTAAASTLGLEVAGGYGHKRWGWRHRHNHHYQHSNYYGCKWKKRKVWSNYYHGWVWKKVKVCY